MRVIIRSEWEWLDDVRRYNSMEQIVRLLVERRARIDLVGGPKGQNALHMAASRSQGGAHIVAQLLLHAARPVTSRVRAGANPRLLRDTVYASTYIYTHTHFIVYSAVQYKELFCSMLPPSKPNHEMETDAAAGRALVKANARCACASGREHSAVHRRREQPVGSGTAAAREVREGATRDAPRRMPCRVSSRAAHCTSTSEYTVSARAVE